MNNILNSGFSGLGLDAFIAKVMLILSQLTGNTNFPTTNPTVAAIKAALGAVTTAQTLPKGQARDTALEAARTNLEELLYDLANNLEQMPDVTEAMLATSGFDLRKASSRSTEPPAVPANLRLKTTGTTGEVQVLFEASDRAKSYEVQTAADPNSGTWSESHIFSSSRGVILRGLPRAKDIWVRVRAIGPSNLKSGWSDPATILVN